MSKDTFLIAIVYNEQEMLPHFIKYYSQFCDKMIFYDGGSTDKTQEIIKSNPICELNLDYVSEKADDLVFLEIKNHTWKKHREIYNWCIIVDIDEFLYYPGGLDSLTDYMGKNSFSVLKPQGWDIYSETFPKESDNLFEKFNKGIISQPSSKSCLFHIKALIDINYSVGAHICNPQGQVKIYETQEAKLLHYRYLDIKKVLKKKKRAHKRMSEINLKRGWGFHNTLSDQTWIDNFNQNLKNSTKII